MEGKAMQFLKKLNSLSEEIQLYFGSEFNAEVSKEIQKDYQLSSDDLDNLIYDIFIADFNFSVLDSGLKATKVPAPTQSKLAADILGKIFLPVASYLKIDVKGEIIKRGHRPEIYKKYEDALVELIEDKNFSSLEELVNLHESTFNPLEEENASLELFTNGLKGILYDDSVEAISSLNGALIYLLINKLDFHNKINKALLENQELLTTQSLTWSEGTVRGTIANWLKDFIRENGSDIYNSVVLSRYLATSPNPQLLTEADRKIVRRLLRLYHNLVFFPESMSDVPAEEWEIIPVEKVSVERPIIGVKPTPVKADVAPVAKKVIEPKLMVAPKTVKEIDIPKIEADLEGSKLASLLTKYPNGSLEAKVVKEEIKRRQGNN